MTDGQAGPSVNDTVGLAANISASSKRGRIICGLIAAAILFAVGNKNYSAVSSNNFVAISSSRLTKNSTAASITLTIDNVSCALGEGRIPTFRCPHRGPSSRLSQAYEHSMLEMYQGTDPKLFLRCANLKIPLIYENSPKDCWPRPFILPSWPTSGNSLIRILLQVMTIPMEIAMHEYAEKGQLLYSNVVPPVNGTINTPFLNIYGELDRPAALPLMRRALLYKSHRGTNTNDETLRQNAANQLAQARRLDRLDGIIRLARNPGDHMLRNTFRWHDKSCYRKGDECFFQRGKVICDQMINQAKNYVMFHEFWNTLDDSISDISQLIVHYEHFVNKDYAGDTIEEILKYVDDLTPEMDYRKFLRPERMEDMLSRIREPAYIHGTLLKRICGEDLARQVHDITSDISTKLGYRFDTKSATWSVDPQKPHAIL